VTAMPIRETDATQALSPVALYRAARRLNVPRGRALRLAGSERQIAGCEVARRVRQASRAEAKRLAREVDNNTRSRG